VTQTIARMSIKGASAIYEQLFTLGAAKGHARAIALFGRLQQRGRQLTDDMEITGRESQAGKRRERDQDRVQGAA